MFFGANLLRLERELRLNSLLLFGRRLNFGGERGHRLVLLNVTQLLDLANPNSNQANWVARPVLVKQLDGPLEDVLVAPNVAVELLLLGPAVKRGELEAETNNFAANLVFFHSASQFPTQVGNLVFELVISLSRPACFAN